MSIDKIYKQYAVNVYRYAYSGMNNREIAEDIVSETFKRFIEGFDSFSKKNAKALPWLIGISRNVMREKYREQLGKDSLEAQEIEAADDERFEPEEITLEKEQTDQIKLLVDRLDGKSKEIVVLRLWEELEYKEISRIIGSSEVAVRQRYSRAVRQLKQRTKEDKRFATLLAVPLPHLLFGLQFLRSGVVPSSEFLSSLGASILIKQNHVMENANMQNPSAGVDSSAPVTSMASAKKIFGLAPKQFAIVSTIVVLIITGGVVSVFMLTNQSNRESEQDKKTSSTSSIEESASVSSVDSTISSSTSTTTTTTQAVDPYAGWNTYTNETYGISIRYPDGWVLDESNPLSVSFYKVGDIDAGVSDIYVVLAFDERADDIEAAHELYQPVGDPITYLIDGVEYSAQEVFTADGQLSSGCARQSQSSDVDIRLSDVIVLSRQTGSASSSIESAPCTEEFSISPSDDDLSIADLIIESALLL